jgi:hypothetical protein
MIAGIAIWAHVGMSKTFNVVMSNGAPYSAEKKLTL